jgi:hypothetical protein
MVTDSVRAETILDMNSIYLWLGMHPVVMV